MKKYIIYLFLLCTPFYLLGQSRCEKGTWVAGINPFHYSVFTSSHYTRFQADTFSYTERSQASGGLRIGFSLNAGYFVKDHLCIGVGWGDHAGYPTVPTNLFARYYLMKKKKCFSFTRQDNSRKSAFFLQGSFNAFYYNGNGFRRSDISSGNGVNSQSSRSDSYGYHFGGKLGAGFTYMIGKRLALELIATSSYLKARTNSEEYTVEYSPGGTFTVPSEKAVGHYYNIVGLLGLQFYF